MDVDRPPLYWKGFLHPAQTQDLFFMKKAQLVMGMIVDCVGTADFQKVCLSLKFWGAAASNVSSDSVQHDLYQP